MDEVTDGEDEDYLGGSVAVDFEEGSGGTWKRRSVMGSFALYWRGLVPVKREAEVMFVCSFDDLWSPSWFLFSISW